MIIVPKREICTRQPSPANSIDRSNVIGRRIVYASAVALGCFDASGKRFPAGVSSNRPTTVSGVLGGYAADFVPEQSQYYDIGTANLVSGFPLTVACWARIDAVTAGGVAYSLNGTNYSAIFGALSSRLLVNKASANSQNSVTATSEDTGWHHIVVTHRATTFSMWVDGKLRAQSAGGSYWDQPAAGNHSIGNRLNGSTPQYFNGAVQSLLVINGDITEGEVVSLYRNHWQVFNRPGRMVFVDSGGGGTLYGAASGSIANTSISAATGGATGSATAAGSVSTVSLSAATGTASTAGDETADGAVAQLSLSVTTGTATGSATASGAVSTIYVIAATGSATAGADVSTSGAIATISLAAATGGASAVGDVVASCTVAPISLVAPSGSSTGTSTTSASIISIRLSAATGTASAGADVSASGSIAVIGFTAPLGASAVSIEAQAALAAIFMPPATGSATGSAVCAGAFDQISLTACRATASSGLEDVEFLRQMLFTRITEQRQFSRLNDPRHFSRVM